MCRKLFISLLTLIFFIISPTHAYAVVCTRSGTTESVNIEYDSFIDANQDDVTIKLSNLTVGKEYYLHVVDLTHAGHANVIKRFFTATSPAMNLPVTKQQLFGNMMKDYEQKKLDIRIAESFPGPLGIGKNWEDICQNETAILTLAPDPDIAGVPVTIRADICDDQESVRTALGCIPFEPVALVGWILRWGISIGGGIAFLLMAFASFQLMTSTGDPEKIKHGQEMFVSAGAGLLFIIFSVFLLQVIGADIIQIPGFGR